MFMLWLCYVIVTLWLFYVVNNYAIMLWLCYIMNTRKMVPPALYARGPSGKATGTPFLYLPEEE